jgi:hypothetical protein
VVVLVGVVIVLAALGSALGNGDGDFEAEDVEELGASRWRQSLQAIAEPRLHLLEDHGRDPSMWGRPNVTAACPRMSTKQGVLLRCIEWCFPRSSVVSAS